MSETVVNIFESVEIEEKHREHVVGVPFGTSDCSFQMVDEKGTVWQACEIVVGRIVRRALLGHSALGIVVHHYCEAVQSLHLVLDGRDGASSPEVSAIFADVPPLLVGLTLGFRCL